MAIRSLLFTGLFTSRRVETVFRNTTVWFRSAHIESNTIDDRIWTIYRTNPPIDSSNKPGVIIYSRLGLLLYQAPEKQS